MVETSGEEPPARKTRIFFPAPITYFDNPMTGFVNCNKELPAIKTNYPMRCLLDCGEVCQRRKSREMYKIILGLVYDVIGHLIFIFLHIFQT